MTVPDETAAERRGPTGRERIVLVAVAVLGIVAVLADRPIADLVAALLPDSALGRGLGTNFESFEVLGPTIVARMGFLAVLGAVVVATTAAIGDRFERERPTPPWLRPVAQTAVGAAVALWYGWLAHPHNAYPSNARYHWVEYLKVDTGNFFYAAGRLPHLVFYDVPYVWKAINVAVLVAVLALIANRLRLSLPASLVVCASPALATNLLLFADTAEDVVLNVTLLLGAVAALMTRRPVVVGSTLALAVLGRPTFLLLAGCLIGAEFLTALRRDPDVPGPTGWMQRIRTVDLRFLVRASGVFVVTTAAFQLLFELLGRRYLFVNGRIVDTGWLDDFEPIDVDGFFISPMSGAYLGHLVWVMPCVLLVGAVISVRLAPRTGRATAVLVHFCALATVGILLAHELKPLRAYNIRYLTYVWPFLFVPAWVLYANRASSLQRHWRAGFLAVLLLGLAVLPVDPVERRRQVEQRDETELLAVRRDLDRRIGDADVVVTFGGRSTRNLLAYVIADDREKVRSIFEPGDVPPDVWVVTRRSEPLADRSPVLETESLLVYAPE